MHRVRGRWQQLWRQIIVRRVPHGVLSWRYLLPGQSRAVRLHRQVFLRAWPSRSRLVWVAIALYSYIVWYAFWGWKQVCSGWRQHSPVIREQTGISRARQLWDLGALAFLQSTPPYFYYRYRLYRYPKRRWLDFVYTHELPHWHLLMSPNLSRRTQHLLSDKSKFAAEMTRRNLPAIPSIHRVKAGGAFEGRRLFCQRDCFLKPLRGSRKQGCFVLLYDSATDGYRLRGAGMGDLCERNGILAFLNGRAREQSYLLQPLLENHPLIQARCPDTELMTIRMITAMTAGTPRAISAVLEIPADGPGNRVYTASVQLDSGCVVSVEGRSGTGSDEWQSRFRQLCGWALPDWQTVIQTAEQAHRSFPELATVGWDLAITGDGVRLLEGNFNWAVEVHQLHGPGLIACFLPC